MKIIFSILFTTVLLFNLTGGEVMPKSRYISLMEKILSAYTNEHIVQYYNEVKANGLKEHGYPRLTANIGILIAHGKRTDLKEQFVQMMDLCCKEIPLHKNAANEFSIKEVIFALLELDKHQTFPREQIERWKGALKNVTVENCYRVYATAPDSQVYNWAAFAMVSEWMRYHIKVAEPDFKFINNQAASQWQFVDVNGMYRDPHEPMIYDMVTRGLFAVLFHFGYRGEYFERWDAALKRAGLLTLKMLSVTGEVPFGGRSNQFLHNESHAALIMEYEAARYARLGDMKMASRFKGSVDRALDNIELWLRQQPITHVKNSFPRSTRYGCEKYAYFDKYMITAASFLYVAYLFCDETIPVGELDDVTGATWQSSDHFHKLFLRAGNYFAEYDYRADYNYDASGLGRLHRKGAPGTIALAIPATDQPKYVVNAEEKTAFAITPEFFHKGQWLSGAAREAEHQVKSHRAQKNSASAEISCSWPDNAKVETAYFLSEKGLQITVKGDGKVGLMLPAFAFDGKIEPEISNDGKRLSIKYQNWICSYVLVDGIIRDTGKTGCNRNGHYKLFRAENDQQLTVEISITPQP